MPSSAVGMSLQPSSDVGSKAGVEFEFLSSGSLALSSRDDNEASEERDLSEPKYNLRPTQRTKNFLNSCLDQDESGDYDPQRIRKTKDVFEAKKHRNGAINVSEPPKDSSRKVKLPSLDHGRQNGLSYPIVLRIGPTALESRRGLDLVEQVKKSSNNWPETQWYNRDTVPNFTEISVDSVRPSRLWNQKNSAKLGALFEPASVDELTLGHPAIRGRKACFELGVTCDLVDEGRYPCQECRDLGLDCELISEPLQKCGCEQCAHRRVVCSFRDAKDRSGPCQQCEDKSFKCIAGPKTGRTRTGPSLNRPLLSRRHRVRKGRRASVQVGDSGPRHRPVRCGMETPCRIDTGCGKDNVYGVDIGCGSDTGCAHETAKPTKRDYSTFVNESNSATPHPTSPRQLSTETILPEPKRRWKNSTTARLSSLTETLDTTKIPAKTPVSETIRTKLAHPITLNHNTEAGGPPCEFCEDTTNGIFGLKQRLVEVMDFHNGDGYIEIGNGYAQEGHQPIYVCVACTESRLQIVKCMCHSMQSVNTEGDDKYELELDTYHHAPFQLCSVCGMQAFFACNTPCRVPEIGCGLALCERCEPFSGQLTEWIERLEKLVSELLQAGATSQSGSESPMSVDEEALVRADACLLKADGQIAQKFGIPWPGSRYDDPIVID